MKKNNKYLIVDLDGTLIRTDLFAESILIFIKQNPFNIFKFVIWLFQGRSVAKERISELIDISPNNLPYEQELIDYLCNCKEQGKQLILATASHKIYANKVADYLGFFDHVIASDYDNNLKGEKKLFAIRDLIDENSFSYAGDSYADRPLWQAATSNIFVNAPTKLVQEAQTQGKVEKIIKSNNSITHSFLTEMRVHQWAKNILIFVPLFTSHEYGDFSLWFSILIAFVSFSFCASGVYFLNDMLDLDADRQHERKRFRPLASGNLPIGLGLFGAITLPLIAFSLSFIFLPVAFSLTLAVYYFITNAYSFFIKQISTADVMTLAILYTMRIVAGSAAIGVTLSSWLMAFSVFVFVSLAYLKRYIEISVLAEDGQKVHGRGYSFDDSETLFSLGISNITASVLVLALYINSNDVSQLYKCPEILWALCFLMLYWGNRIWVGARRGKIADDPIVFALKDKVSRFVALFFIIIVLLAKFIQI